MKIVTFELFDSDGNSEVFALTRSEWKRQGIPEDWNEFVWQDQPSKAAAIARHDTAMELFHSDVDAHGECTMETY